MPQFEEDYRKIIKKALSCRDRQTRNAVTRGYFGEMLKTDIMEFGSLPLITGRKIYHKGIVGELASFLQGATSVDVFKANGCNYWDSWADDTGKLNIDYGTSWRDFNGVDQLSEVVKSLMENPKGRRHIISAWRPDRLAELALPCCHYSYQWYVTTEGTLDMIWVQRSVDLMVGLPSDMLLAAVFNMLMAQTVGLKPGTLTFHLGDCHVYQTHLPQVEEYLGQPIELFTDVVPASWELGEDATVFNFEPSMLEITNYSPAEPIKFELIP